MRTAALVAALAATTSPAAPPRAARRREPPPVRTVADADLGRLAPEQMAPLQAARAALDEARDATARARARLQDARHEEGWPNADRAQAEGDRLRAAAELSSAQRGGRRAQGRARDRAREDAAALRTQAAHARLDYARRLVQAREAEVATAEARVRRAEWEVERGKLAALRQAGVPAATKYDPAPLDRRVGGGAPGGGGGAGALARARGAAQAALRAGAALADRYEARARSIPTG